MSDNKLLQVVAQASDLVVFHPTSDQRRAKSNFWSHFSDGDTQVPLDISLAYALKLGADKRISTWWQVKEFQDWFTNKDEFRQRLEYLTHLVLDTFETVLTDPKAQAGAKVNAGKIILEAASKMPKGRGEEKYMDAQIATMDRKQLEEFIHKSMKLLPAPNNSLTDSEVSDSVDTNP